jgi:hypothetical protein
MPAAFLGWVVAAGLAGPATAGASHEWRAAWASPQTLETIEALVGAPEESVRVELSTAHPYNLRELATARARVRLRAWEMHAGGLRGPDYQEWHLGLGRTLAIGPPARLLLGVRLFGIRVPGATPPVRGALTAMLCVTPAGWGGLRLEAGVVDVGFSRRPDQPAALLVVRLRATGADRRALLERSVTTGGAGETTLAVGYPLGRIRLAHAARLTTGEGSIVVTLPAGSAEVSLTERWHPALGWTPAATVRW